MWQRNNEFINNNQNNTSEKTPLKTILFPKELPKRKKEKCSCVLYIQILICIIFSVTAIGLAKINPNEYTTIKNLVSIVVEQGVNLKDENEIARVVSALFSQDNIGQGGFFKSNSNETPTNCSFDRYTLTEKLVPPVIGVITSSFGHRVNPINSQADFHTGIDIMANEKDIFVSAFDGTVTNIGYNNIRGNFIEITHKNNVITKYSHLYKQCIKIGDNVKAGQRIGLIGSTGMSTGPHLHFELMVDGVYVNPFTHLDLPIYQAL